MEMRRHFKVDAEEEEEDDDDQGGLFHLNRPHDTIEAKQVYPCHFLSERLFW